MRKKLKISHFWVGFERTPINMLIKEFKKKFPSISVEVQQEEWGMYFPILWAKIAEGNPPDVSITEIGQRLVKLANTGCLADLTDFWHEQGYQKIFSKEMKEGCTVGGKMYGVPSKEYTFVVWYLKDVFEEKGFKPPKTWDQFLRLCDEIKEEGTYPIISSGWGTSIWLEYILLGLGGSEFYSSLLRGEKSWTDPMVVEAYQWLKKLVSEYFYPYPYAYSFPVTWMKLNEREAAMQLQGDWVDGMWQMAYGYSSGEDYDYFILPPINSRVKRTMVLGGNAWIVFESPHNRRKAMKFLEYVGSREAHEILARGGMGILSRRDVRPDVYNKTLRELREILIKSRKVPEFGVVLPQEFIDFEGTRRIQILLSSEITTYKIKNLLYEVEEEFKKIRPARGEI